MFKISNLTTRLVQHFGEELRGCSLASLPPGTAAKVRLEQVRQLSIFIAVMSVTGFGTDALVAFEFWDTADRALLLVAGGVIALCYGALLGMSFRWGFGTRIELPSAERVRRKFVRVCLTLGSFWGLLLLLLMRNATGDEASLLYGVIIGLISAGVVVTPPSAAFAFWLPVTLGGVAAITFVSHARDFGGTILLAGYTSLSLFCLLYLNRAMIRRVLAEVGHSDGRETIDMLLRDFEDSACDWLWETSPTGQLTHVSARFADAARVSREQLMGGDLVAFIEARRRRLRPGFTRRRAVAADLKALMACQMPFRDIEVALELNGVLTWWALTGKPMFSAQNVFEGYRGVGSDITKAKLSNDRADFLAHFDELTGLANRRLFKEQLSSRLSDGEMCSVALLCLDLDGFKAINDNHGHPVGDALLTAVARRLQSQVRDTDLCARLGGDEFAVVVDHDGPEMLEGLARRLIADLSMPFETEQAEVKIGASIGIAIATREDRSDVSLLRNADAALYEAKAAGRGTLRFYSMEMKEQGNRRRMLKAELPEAIRNDDLHLEYQPIFELLTGELSGVEALVRWTRHSGEALSPAEFVPLAESSRAIDDLGRWVLARACREAARLPSGMKLAVNVSPLQLNDRRLVNHIHEALRVNRLDPRQLHLEVTETAFFEMGEATLGMLRELSLEGIGISLDDFGVGQTSLGQLRRFPFSSLKIDRSFVQDLPGNPSARAIVKGLTTMAADLDMTVTAEGVETLEQLHLVRRARCDYVQGFFLAKPLTISKLIEADYWRNPPACLLTTPMLTAGPLLDLGGPEGTARR